MYTKMVVLLHTLTQKTKPKLSKGPKVGQALGKIIQPKSPALMNVQACAAILIAKALTVVVATNHNPKPLQ
jgi:hypothetical protein